MAEHTKHPPKPSRNITRIIDDHVSVIFMPGSRIHLRTSFVMEACLHGRLWIRNNIQIHELCCWNMRFQKLIKTILFRSGQTVQSRITIFDASACFSSHSVVTSQSIMASLKLVCIYSEAMRHGPQPAREFQNECWKHLPV